jgi:NADH:ubiquinone oxidoreductase subunit 4 (subunit M)|tara:strand:- start:768 stop:908 length:141 start_codon:yes stop_codon:yes gene_type:complete
MEILLASIIFIILIIGVYDSIVESNNKTKQKKIIKNIDKLNERKTQ